MLSIKNEKVKRQVFITLTLSPHVLTQPEMDVLWCIARYGGDSITHLYGPDEEDTEPYIRVDSGYNITIPQHIINTLERRGLLKQRRVRLNKFDANLGLSYYVWDIIWKNMKAKFYTQTKELIIQHAIGSI